MLEVRTLTYHISITLANMERGRKRRLVATVTPTMMATTTPTLAMAWAHGAINNDVVATSAAAQPMSLMDALMEWPWTPWAGRYPPPPTRGWCEDGRRLD